MSDNRGMVEIDHGGKIGKIIKDWYLGKKMDKEGYEDLGFTIQQNALNEALKLNPDDRQKIADKLFPIEQDGN